MKLSFPGALMSVTLLSGSITATATAQDYYQHHHRHGGNQSGGYHSLIQQDNHVAGEEQWIQNRLNQGNLTPQQQSNLQNRLTQLQGQQRQINGQLSGDLSARQGQLQNMLNSGTLNSQQQADV